MKINKLFRSLTASIGILASIALSSSMAQAASNFRIATFNTSLSPNQQNGLIDALSIGPNDPAYNTPGTLTYQARQIAEVIQRINPDIILLNEFNYNPANPVGAATLFQQNFLSVGQNVSGDPNGPASPITFNEFYVRPDATTNPFNTGIFSGYALNVQQGGAIPQPSVETSQYANTSWGFGFYPGQYGMVVYSKYPILEEQARTFQNFLWQDMPNNLLPTDWYSPTVAAQFPLSSKSHWDLPIDVNGEIIHVLASHPTPPVFDGPEDRNGRRNHDEIRLWSDYITPGQGNYIYDDKGVFGGLTLGSRFVIMGDQNADPYDGDSSFGAINQLVDNPLINTSFTPGSLGGVQYTDRNPNQIGNPFYDTAAFTGGLRVDYVLPSTNLQILDGLVFWPTDDNPLSSLNNASDHHAVALTLTAAVPEPNTILGVFTVGIFGFLYRKHRNSN
ncbi:endonuclease/exonuclease/phosphatase family protein [Gloeothece verrucosa]|uniref:Endonuclease/exonuclease/phosphatase n=1 Tax=Gloeothece verrucosa (strain PCC 7822) TaxID=497965 RepID=E0ULH4_GLOV7|nr:endonuclease/exonuclease/phosphatase family protein [Gloeothece verrucosa]ADN17804.1 Endonuclease/exonuclease/phosphatase [Gloeothece verrucosa PCC 7822]